MAMRKQQSTNEVMVMSNTATQCFDRDHAWTTIASSIPPMEHMETLPDRQIIDPPSTAVGMLSLKAYANKRENGGVRLKIDNDDDDNGCNQALKSPSRLD
jgi:hypothetical protein